MQKRSDQNFKGIDVSHWQGEIQWEKVKNAGMSFVYIKATEGTSVTDPCFSQNVKGAKQAGLMVGAYHFGRFKDGEKAEKEANHFAQIVKPFSLDLPPVLDIETNQGLSKKDLSSAALVFRQRLKSQLSADCMLYTSTHFAKEHLDLTVKKLPVWIAHYGVLTPKENGIWENWDVFQFSDQGTVPGIKGNVDLNEWDRTRGEAFFAAKSTTIQREAPIQNHTAHLIIKKGDTFWDLETKNGWSHGTLTKLNPGIDPRKLQIGQKISCPHN
ncbi:GH25 family lysozyme [Pullulanibacillus sp. KACC 23026]|uniref:GH25 family lysozyme n=1 Tax=Pullulanibacillus sp. KACC 23026 TaxID=3028315 RepID=UPI0023B1A6F8|nr:GH25 family lysozyme [Pullulanibacillus sp. KACC 23026]WEG13820.1 GH25 family lysozyme [Pullulanibacillus sp. KACC 23026]